MRLVRVWLSVFAIGALLVSSMPAQAASVMNADLETRLESSGAGELVPVIVRFKSNPNVDIMSAAKAFGMDRPAVEVALRNRARVAQASFRELVDNKPLSSTLKDVHYYWIANAASMTADAATIRAIAQREDVAEVIEDEVIQLDPTIEGEQPKGEQDGDGFTYGLKIIKVPELRNVYGLDGSGVVVGHIDTGIDPTHPDLEGRVIAWKDFVGSKPEAYDDQGHGTHTAGTVAGGNTSGLSIGVAPGAKLIVAKAFSASGSAQTSWLLGAMEWVVDPDGDPNTPDGPSIVTNSWGGGPGRTVFLEATRAWVALGVFPCFAAGNSGPGAGTVGTPGGFVEAFAVGATTKDDTIASFSSRGPATWDGVEYIKPEVSAPGHNVTSAKNGGGYRTISGTSMATPHVAGLYALLKQAQPNLTIQQAWELIEGTSDDLGEPGKDNSFGTGRINALTAASIAVSGGTIAGKLTNADTGAGLYGTIKILEKDFSVQTNRETGEFKIVLPEGTYTLSASSFGYTAASGVQVSVTPQQETYVELNLAPAASGTLQGTVKSADTGEQLSATITVLNTPLAPVQTSSETGTFSISLPGGTYDLLISAWGYEPLTAEGVEVTEDATSEALFELEHLPPILVVDDDAGKGYESFYRGALDAVGQEYSYLNYSALQSGISGDILNQYSTVFWFTGDAYRDTVTAADQAALTEFLGSGGNLFISGQDIGYEIKNTDFYKNTLKATWEKDTSASKEISGLGSTFKIEGGDGANNQRYPDKIAANAGAEVYLSYGNDQGPAGLKIQGENSRIIYLAFGFEGIESAEARNAVMSDAVDYLGATRKQRIARISTMPKAQAAAYADLMAREVSGLSAAEAKSLSKEIAGLKGALYGKVKSVLAANQLR